MFGLFGKKKHQPIPAEIHPADLELVTEQDRKWFEKLTLASLQHMLEQDDTARLALFMSLIEKGTGEKDAAARVRKFHVYYYTAPPDRTDEHFSGEDACLPICVKDRVNRLVPLHVNKEVAESSSSMNSIVRQLLRQHRA